MGGVGRVVPSAPVAAARGVVAEVDNSKDRKQ